MFEVNIRFVGGLLSAYYLSGKDVSVFFWLIWFLSAFVPNQNDVVQNNVLPTFA